jgi:RNA polymerase sigma-70 factor, ECF subfamily
VLYPTEPDPHLTRATLLLRLKSDSPEQSLAWQEFYEIYGAIIGGFARNMGAPAQDISDVVHDVLVGFFSISPTFIYDPAKGRFRGYLKTCTWRVLKRRLGKSARVSGQAVEDLADDSPEVDQIWNDVWEGERLRNAVEIVRKRYVQRPDTAKTFQAFEMYALLDQTAEDIAQQLGISVNSVHQAKSRVSKAIKAVMDELDGSTG